ncbi:kininogen-1-like isoform X1 [Myotis daubentonii]|uniref:kininogen-1-like isoform X1 n=1 Tax=Myotis daubentonii TaxID=98922 RepID=UPI0028735B37|nr:kininogen-1-like isoform X1 [Myotis daubentonii]
MKLIAILFLCSRLLTSFAQEDQPQEVDCNDEDVFKAVDAALKKYNDGSKSGNQFVLYRITEGNKTVHLDIFYSVNYEIKEGNCPVQSGKTWQDCNYKEPEQAATGECMATIGKRRNVEFAVTSQTCHITPAKGPVVTSEYECHGCLNPIRTVPADFNPVLRHAIEHFNNHTNHSHLFALKEVKRAQRQVVSGWNYEVTYLIEQTNCSKENFKFLNQDCKALRNGDTGECTDLAYVDPQLRIASFSQKCEILPGEDFTTGCLGCPDEIPVDSPELNEALNHSITKLNAQINSIFLFKINIVHRATSQVVSGFKYFIDFTAKETTCSKQRHEELSESCEFKKHGAILRCTFDVYHPVGEKKKIDSTFKCQSPQKEQLRPCVYKGRPQEAGA